MRMGRVTFQEVTAVDYHKQEEFQRKHRAGEYAKSLAAFSEALVEELPDLSDEERFQLVVAYTSGLTRN